MQEEIQFYLFLIFTHFLWIHPHRSIGKELLHTGKNLSILVRPWQTSVAHSKYNWGFLGGSSSATPMKLCILYSYLSLETLFPALKLPQNCFITNIGSPTHQIYPAWKKILTIWQNIKARELQKSQFPNYLVNCKILGSTV